MDTEQVAIPDGFVPGTSSTYTQYVTSRYNSLQTALKGGLSVLITTAHNNLQSYALDPCSLALGRDPTPPEGWNFHIQATKFNGTVVTDPNPIYPGVVKQADGSLVLEYPVI